MVKGKFGQVTIFIIIAILLVALVGLFFIVRDKIPPSIGGTKGETNPTVFLEDCLEDEIKETVKLIGERGGNMEPELYKTFTFTEESKQLDLTFLCYVRDNTRHCVNQEPGLIGHIEEEVHDSIEDKMLGCFTDLASNFEGRGYVVDSTYNGFNIVLSPEKITSNIKGKLILTKAEQTTREEDFKIIIPSRIYELAIFANKIVRKEAETCKFDIALYDVLYPKIDMEKDQVDGNDPAYIYTLKDKRGDETFRFAVSKGCMNYE